MKLLPRPALICLVLACGLPIAAAEAATVYRCGPAGNVYSDLPCADGRPVRADDPRTEAQRLDGLRVASLEKRYAAELQGERLRREAAPAAQAIGIGARAPVLAAAAAHRPAKPSPHRRHHKLASARGAGAGSDFIAIAPRPAARP